MFEELLSRIALVLLRHNVPYIVTGGAALLLYGEPKLVRDIDVLIGLDARCINLLISIVREMGLSPVPEDAREYIRQNMVLPAIDEASSIRVDFILSLTPYEAQAIKRTVKLRINDQRVCFASCEDLIIHKILSGAPPDIIDMQKLVARHRGSIDGAYVRKWLREFDASFGKGEFMKTFESAYKGDSLPPISFF
ncbi:MAG: DUF6036 family nucleotidyltransferase [Candidatus Eremiobacteraeota bacterium]|nr:DUF6036 family nucleotidyltransferase [Candidatus Eremiobacteraeota bacterium]